MKFKQNSKIKNNSVQSIKTIAYFFTISFLTGSGCGPQTSGGGPIVKHHLKTSSVDEGTNTSMEITGGKAEGTSIDIPSGSLAVGSEVNLSQVDTPSEFEIANVGEASSAIEVEAIAPDGSSITTLDAPMTIAIPYETTALFALAEVEETVDNLCAVLSGPAGLFVWRRSGISLDTAEGKASFKSLNLGIFQLVFCGEEEMSGFTDANESGAAETRSELSIAIDTDAYGFGADHYCVIVISDSDKGEGEGDSSSDEERTPSLVIGSSEGKIDGSEISLSLPYSPDDIPTENKAIVAFAIQSEDQSCSTIAKGTDIDASGISYSRVFVFPFSKDSLAAGDANGTLGTGSYELNSFNLTVGAPAGAANPGSAPQAKKACFEVDGSGGFSESIVSLDTSGKINGADSYQIYTPAGDGSAVKFKVKITGECGPGSGDNETDSFEPYDLKFGDVAFGSDQYLFPLSLSTSAIFGSGTSCLRIFNGTGLDSDNTGPELGVYNITIGETHLAYIPWDETQMNGTMPEYDMQLRVGAGCNDRASQIPALPAFQNRVLNSSISLAP